MYTPPPQGPEVEQYLAQMKAYATREDKPVSWVQDAYLGEDYLERMKAEHCGDIVVLAGNNKLKARYTAAAVESGNHVLSDKPMAITAEDFILLEKACRKAEAEGLAVQDLMTERYDVLNIAVKDIIADKELFGEIEKGSKDDPAVKMCSVHHFYKEVSGAPLTRPAWYYDVRQQGEGIADVTTHLIDLLFWQCFPGEAVRYGSDVRVLEASHYPTPVTLEQYSRSTGMNEFPDYLNDCVKDGVAYIMSNGSVCFEVKGVVAKMDVVWNYQAPAGGGDTFTATIRGTKATIEIIQDASTGFVKELYVRNRDGELRHMEIPAEVRPGHEEHFSMVTQSFLEAVSGQKLPDWERENLLSKYFITTQAVEIANN